MPGFDGAVNEMDSMLVPELDSAPTASVPTSVSAEEILESDDR